MKGKKRIPKKEYFTQRLNESLINGNTKKANYYANRLKQLNVSPIESKENLFITKFKEVTKDMNEKELLMECNRLIKYAIKRGQTVNQVVAVLSKAGVNGTIISHATTF